MVGGFVLGFCLSEEFCLAGYFVRGVLPRVALTARGFVQGDIVSGVLSYNLFDSIVIVLS